MTTMHEEWKQYWEKCHPKPEDVPMIQNIECHQAFFASALAMLGIFDEIAALPEVQAVAAYGKLRKEILETVAAMVQTYKRRN